MSIRIVQGDITTLDVGGIVNAANGSLLGGGGVDGAIHRVAGTELALYCEGHFPVQGGVRLRTGQSVITPGFKLKAPFVIHTVGPVWRGGGEGEGDALASCYRTAMGKVLGAGIGSVAFPAISCGVYGYPHQEAASIAVQVLSSKEYEGVEITLCLFTPELVGIFEDALRGAAGTF